MDNIDWDTISEEELISIVSSDPESVGREAMINAIELIQELDNDDTIEALLSATYGDGVQHTAFEALAEIAHFCNSQKQKQIAKFIIERNWGPQLYEIYTMLENDGHISYLIELFFEKMKPPLDWCPYTKSEEKLHRISLINMEYGEAQHQTHAAEIIRKFLASKEKISSELTSKAKKVLEIIEK